MAQSEVVCAFRGKILLTTFLQEQTFTAQGPSVAQPDPVLGQSPVG